MSKIDRFLQGYFKDLGIALGFGTNVSLSLFDLPSILNQAFNYKDDALENILVRDIFIYSQCELGTFQASEQHSCYTSLTGGNGKFKLRISQVRKHF